MKDRAVLQLCDVSKRYAGHDAVNALDLIVPRGAVYGLLGPNGAGKTTTIGMIMNIIAPDGGRVELFGSAQNGRAVARRVGSALLLVSGLALVTWVAGRILRVAIMMQGKRPNPKELWRWIRAS